MSAYIYQSLQGLGLSPSLVLSVMPSVRSVSLQAGSAVSASEGAGLHDLLHVKTGLVCIQWGEGNHSTPLEIYGPGSWICAGIPSLCYSGSLHTLLATTLLCVPGALAAEAFESEPGFARYVARTLMWRAEYSAQILGLTKSGSPHARAVLGMALLSRALASASSHLPTLVMAEESIPLPLKQQVLALYLGLSRRQLSMSLQQLSKAGWVRLGYGCIELVKPKVWNGLYEKHSATSKGRGGQDRLSDMPISALLEVMESLDAT